jgi:hypothetical protein
MKILISLACVVSVLGFAACSKSAKPPAGPAGGGGGTCPEANGNWELKLTWNGDVPPACAEVTAPWDDVIMFPVTRNGDDVAEIKPGSMWGGSAIQVTNITIADGTCDAMINANTQGKEQPDSELEIQLKMDSAEPGTVHFSRADPRESPEGGAEPCVREGTVVATRK